MSDGEFWEAHAFQRDARKTIESRSKRLTPPLQGQSKRVLKESDSSEPLISLRAELKVLIDFHGMGEIGTAQRGMYNHIRSLIEPST